MRLIRIIIEYLMVSKKCLIKDRFNIKTTFPTIKDKSENWIVEQCWANLYISDQSVLIFLQMLKENKIVAKN